MHHFYLVTNIPKDPELVFTRSVIAFLRQRGMKCTLQKEVERHPERKYRYTDPDRIPEDVDCIIVLGGDGTLILTATDTIQRQIPLLGINLGTLGYLAEIDRTSVFSALKCVLDGNYHIEKRMLLKGNVHRQDGSVEEEIALNDVVIRRNDVPGLITVENYVNDAYLNSYKADGVIISTPTGSTGYSLSVGGPIIAPQAEMFLMTPLAAHALNTRSIVLPSEDRITIVIGPGRDGTSTRAAAYFDGETKAALDTDDRIDIRRETKHANLIKIHHDSFLEILSRKMNR